MELLPLSKISKYFPSQPDDEHIHIIVQCPIETKEVPCTATFGRKSKKFQWTLSRGTEDEHIVINRECGSEKEIVCLVDDEDLASVIWKVDLPIVVDTCNVWYRFDRSRLGHN